MGDSWLQHLGRLQPLRLQLGAGGLGGGELPAEPGELVRTSRIGRDGLQTAVQRVDGLPGPVETALDASQVLLGSASIGPAQTRPGVAVGVRGPARSAGSAGSAPGRLAAAH
ncbi:MAG: hypothetical protein ACFNZX_04775, partial [Actinomyces sp.]